MASTGAQTTRSGIVLDRLIQVREATGASKASNEDGAAATPMTATTTTPKNPTKDTPKTAPKPAPKTAPKSGSTNPVTLCGRRVPAHPVGPDPHRNARQNILREPLPAHAAEMRPKSKNHKIQSTSRAGAPNRNRRSFWFEFWAIQSFFIADGPPQALLRQVHHAIGRGARSRKALNLRCIAASALTSNAPNAGGSAKEAKQARRKIKSGRDPAAAQTLKRCPILATQYWPRTQAASSPYTDGLYEELKGKPQVLQNCRARGVRASPLIALESAPRCSSVHAPPMSLQAKWSVVRLHAGAPQFGPLGS